MSAALIYLFLLVYIWNIFVLLSVFFSNIWPCIIVSRWRSRVTQITYLWKERNFLYPNGSTVKYVFPLFTSRPNQWMYQWGCSGGCDLPSNGSSPSLKIMSSQGIIFFIFASFFNTSVYGAKGEHITEELDILLIVIINISILNISLIRWRYVIE